MTICLFISIMFTKYVLLSINCHCFVAVVVFCFVVFRFVLCNFVKIEIQ